jgi:histone H4
MAKGKKSGGDAKGSTKRMKKLLRDNIKSITKGSILRLARRAGSKRVSSLVYDDVRSSIKNFVNATVRDATSYCEHASRKTVSALDVVLALKKRGKTIYGYA